LQGLKAFVAVMLAKWRYHPNPPADGCTEFASALATLPSPTLELVADAVAAQVGAAVEALGFSNAPPPPPPPPVPQQTDGEFAELMAELGFEL
jgi:hypothetical protein